MLATLTLLAVFAAGDWWLEFHRLLTARDVQLLAAAAKRRVHLPADFVTGHEVMRSTAREHCRYYVAGHM